MSNAQLERILLAYNLRRGSNSRYGERDRSRRQSDEVQARKAQEIMFLRCPREQRLAGDVRRRGRL
jgi:hypothetical protein